MKWISGLIVVLMAVSAPLFAEGDVKKINGLFPGLYQFKTGQHNKGLAFSVLFTSAIVPGAYLKVDSDGDKFFRQYEESKDQWEADRLYRKAEKEDNRERLGIVLLWGAAWVYAVNLVDVVMYKQKKASAYQGSVVPMRGGAMARFCWRW